MKNTDDNTMKLAQTLILIIACIHLNAQETFNWPIKELDTARNVSYLTEDEKDVILELNMLRYAPAQYALDFMQWMEPFYSGKLLKLPGKMVFETNEGIAAYHDCMEFLKTAEPAPILKPSRGMTKGCELLVLDQSSTGKTGHRGSGNSTPADRAENFGQFTGYFAENIHYGDVEPRFIIISLLIDDGVKSRGHRKNMLDKSFHYTGVDIGSHKIYGNMCVNTYATNFIEKPKK